MVCRKSLCNAVITYSSVSDGGASCLLRNADVPSGADAAAANSVAAAAATLLFRRRGPDSEDAG